MNAPRRCPNNSESASDSAIAPTLRGTYSSATRRIGSELPVIPGSGQALGGAALAEDRTVTIERPMTKLSAPDSNRAWFTRAPPTNTPFFEPKSATTTLCSSARSSQ